MKPGATQFTVIPRLPSSRASARVMPSSPALAPARTRCVMLAWPMPREAPVTRATSPFNASPRSTDHWAISAPQTRQRLAQGGRIRNRQAVQLRRDAPGQSRQNLAGTALDDVGYPALAHGSDDLRPAHRAGRPARQRITDARWVRL